MLLNEEQVLSNREIENNIQYFTILPTAKFLVLRDSDTLCGTPSPGESSGEKMIPGLLAFMTGRPYPLTSFSVCAQMSPQGRRYRTYSQSDFSQPSGGPVSPCRTATAIYHLKVFASRRWQICCQREFRFCVKFHGNTGFHYLLSAVFTSSLCRLNFPCTLYFS